jgi:hypothetical protein
MNWPRLVLLTQPPVIGKMVCLREGQQIPLGSIPVIDGVRTCPGHFMDWRESDGSLVRRTKWRKRCGINRTKEDRIKDLEV